MEAIAQEKTLWLWSTGNPQ